MIDFNTMEPTVIKHFRDGEGELIARMVGDDYNRILRGTLASGCSIGMHCHDTSSEIIYILSGVGAVVVDGEEETLPAGTCHYCRKGQTHSLINRGEENLEFFAVIPQQ